MFNSWKDFPPFDNHSGSEQCCPCLPSPVAQFSSCQWVITRICCNVFYFAVTSYTNMQLCGIKLMNLRLSKALTCPFFISLGSGWGLHITLEWIRLSSTQYPVLGCFMVESLPVFVDPYAEKLSLTYYAHMHSFSVFLPTPSLLKKPLS